MSATVENTEITEITENGTDETATTKTNPRAARMSAKARQMQAEAAASPAIVNGGTQAKARTVNAVPKPGAAGKKAKPEAEPDSAEAIAEKERNAAAKQQEAEAKRIAAAAAAEKKAAEKAEREAAAAVKAAEKAEREAAAKAKKDKAAAEKAEREAAAAARKAATAPTIADFNLDDYPSTDIPVLVEKLINLPEMVGASPDAAFVRSVKKHGVIDAITLIRTDENDTELRIAGGRRRVKASQMSGRNEVPARIYSVGKDKENIVWALTMQLNALRSENFAADVQAIENYREKYPNMSNEQIAREIGIPYSTVKKRARLIGLRPELRELLYSGVLKHTVVVEISGMEREQQDQLLKIFRESGKLTHKDIQAVRNPDGKASNGGESDNVDVDALMNGASVSTAVPTIPDTGDLASDLLGFLESVTETSGIAFQVSDTGELSFVRGGQRIVFQAAADTADAAQ